MQRFQAVPPVGIIFDCDLGNDIEDALALALLYGLEGKQECRAVGTTVSRTSLASAAFCEVIGRFYAGQAPGELLTRFRALPVGMPEAGPKTADTSMLTAPLSRKTAEGSALYRHTIERLVDTAEPVNVLRNALSAQHPQNAILVVSGPLTNLSALLRHPPAEAFITERCKLLVVAAGRFAAGKPEAAIQADIAAAKHVFTKWPTPIVAVGAELGEAIPFPGASIDKDFAWSDAHPVVDAYRAFRAMPYDATTTAMAAVLYAVREKASLFSLSAPGTVIVSDDGVTTFREGNAGSHRHLGIDPANIAKVQEAYIQLASAKPVPRGPRRPPAPPPPAAPKPPSSEAKPNPK
jgi:hypothetical protein